MAFFLSRLLGLVRDRLLATNFGIGAQTDAYTAAFRIPDLLFTLLVSGAFAVSFIPVFVGFLERDKQEEAWKVANIALTLMMCATLVLGVMAFIFAPQLVHLITPGFDPARQEMTIHLTRIMLITPFLFGLASVFGAIQQAYNRFLLFALSSIFYNVGIIIGITVLAKWFSPSIYGVAWGVVLGTAIQAFLQIFGLIGLGYKFGFKFEFWHPSIRKIVKLMIPRSLDLAVDQFNTIVETIIGSRLITGSLTSYYYANNLRNVPIGLFGQAIATAAFPSLIRASKSSDKSRLPKTIVQNVRLLAFLTIPAAAIAIVLRGYIIRLLFGFGSGLTGNVLGLLAPTIVAVSIYFLIARVFYALEDTRTPLATSVCAIALNVGLSLYLSKRYGVAGLAAALSIVSVFELTALTLLLRRKIGPYGLDNILRGVGLISLASFGMAVAVRAMVYYVLPLRVGDQGFRILAPKFTVICLVGIATYVILSRLLRIREMGRITDMATRRLRKWPHTHKE